MADTKENIIDYAKTGVDAISSGSLIHQATWLDFSMRITHKTLWHNHQGGALLVPDDQEKTEATPKKLEDARKRARPLCQDTTALSP